ncbi:MAG: tetratricopeptide repeat protein [Ktedonobacteraceae bacterium]|nr:tetratricopeptide repeat protein [Ktedonobacteraceae bacterium]
MKNILLRQARIARGWSQEDLAEHLKVHRTTVNRWEQGTLPERFHQEQISLLFEKNFVQLGFLPDGMSTPLLDPFIPSLSSLSLIGRTLFSEEIKQRLVQERSGVQVAFHGLPGVGKTAIAIALAHEKDVRAHFDGILWAGMGPTANVEGILSRWSTLFGMSANGLGTLNHREIWAHTLREYIGQSRFLIVLDDAWNLADAFALKLGGENCAYVLTTRLPALAAEFAQEGATHVTEMGEAESIDLLKFLAPELASTNTETIRMLVHVAGGLPLALTLAGRYLHAQAYQRPLRRLQSSIERLLTADERLYLSQPTAFNEAHPSLPVGSPLSLQTLIAVSDERLDPRAQTALRSLAVFPSKPNTFSEEAAIVVAACTLEALDTLTDAGLLESSGSGRYTLHQTIADYARAHQADVFSVERLVSFVVPFVEAHQLNYEMLEQERDNILTALDLAYTLGKQEAFVRIICSFAPFLLLRGLYEQAKIHLLRAYQMVKIVDTLPLTIACFHHLGMVAQKQGEYTQATEYYQEGLELARGANEKERICEFLSDLGWVTEKRGLYEQAHVYAQDGLSLANQIKNETYRARLLTVLGVIADNRGEYIRAEAYYQEALTIVRRINNREQECMILIDLGANASEQGMSKEASYFQREH